MRARVIQDDSGLTQGGHNMVNILKYTQTGTETKTERKPEIPKGTKM